MKSVVVRFIALVLVFVLVAPSLDAVSAQRPSRGNTAEQSLTAEGNTSAALVSGAHRFVIHQTAIVGDPDSIGASGNGPVVAALADVTNLGAAGPFDPATVSVGVFKESPLEMVDGVAADAAESSAATIDADLSLDGNFTIAENTSIRLVLVFPLADVDEDARLGVRVDEQVASVESTMVSQLDNSAAPEFKANMELRVADVTGAPGSGKLSVVFRDGAAEDIEMAAIDTPEAGSTRLPGCYFNESSAAIVAMTGGTVWLEEDEDGYLVWLNNPTAGTFDLLQWRVAQEGFGGTNSSEQSAYTAWLAPTTDWAQSEGTGMWTDCTTALGEWKVQPTPAPEPTKTPQEIRADYQWIDARDLVIRPGSFEGQKIAVQGTVFDIEVEGNLTVMQIWINGGNYDNVIIAYEGDSVGIYEGTWVTVYGEGAGTITGTNAFGGPVTAPLIYADIVDF